LSRGRPRQSAAWRHQGARDGFEVVRPALAHAVELLAGERQALLVMDPGGPAGIVTRADLLEALAR
jgi:predicted transcriptional regulator